MPFKKRVRIFLKSCQQRFKNSFKQSPATVALLLSLMTGVMVNAIWGSWAWKHYVLQDRTEKVQRIADEKPRHAASNISTHITKIKNTLLAYGNTSQLKADLQFGQQHNILAMETQLKEQFPSAKTIQIFRFEEAKKNPEQANHGSFATLDLIDRAEHNLSTSPEAIKINNEWLVNIVYSIRDDSTQQTLGTLLLTLPINDVLKEMVRGLDHVGKLSLYQTNGSDTTLLGYIGEGNLYTTPKIAVANTPWMTELNGSETLLNEVTIDINFYLLVGVVTGLSIMALFLAIGLGVGRFFHRHQMALKETHQRMGHANPEAPIKRDITHLAMRQEDKHLVVLEEDQASSPEELTDTKLTEELNHDSSHTIPEHIFRCYDIRGRVPEEIDKNLANLIGKALGSEALDKGERSLLVARDARTHSPILMENLIRGILSTGCKVLNIGTVPTPLLYFAIEKLDATNSGLVVTASHNPADYNGFKMVMQGQARTEQDVKAVYTRIIKNQFRQGLGTETQIDIIETYIDAIFSDVALASEITLVIDAANGVTGKIAPRLFEQLGCQVIPLYCDLDGQFPHHGPDPSKPENLQDLIAKVQESKAHLGVAFDGDGDRLTIVTPKGQIIWPDRLLMLFAKDILARNPGADIIFDVKCSRQLNQVISQQGGRPIMWKTGHAPMRRKVMETGALLGGEFSGHIFIKDRWHGFDDGLYAAARLVEIMSLRDESLDEIFEEFPPLSSTPEIRFPVNEDLKFEIIRRLTEEGDFGDAKVITLDGLRIEFPFGWALVRASNTGPELTFRFEAEQESQIHELKALVTREIHQLECGVTLRW